MPWHTSPLQASNWDGEGLEMLSCLGFARQDQALKRVEGSPERTYKLTAPRRWCPGCVHPASPSHCQEEEQQGETRERSLHLSGGTPVEREAEVRRSEAANCSSQKAQVTWDTMSCPWKKGHRALALSSPTPAEALVGLPQFEPGRQGKSRGGGGSSVPPGPAHRGRHLQLHSCCEGH